MGERIVVKDNNYIVAGEIDEVRAKGIVLIDGHGVTIAVFADGDRLAAVDNRCPHMGFPLHRGTLQDGILTCHWHHARFDLVSGCTFDLFADDVPSYDVQIVDGKVLVSLNPRQHKDAGFFGRRLQRGLDLNVGLTQAKALLGLLSNRHDVSKVISSIANFAATRLTSWGEGLVRLTCVANLVSYLSKETLYLSLYYATRKIADEASVSVPHRLRGALDGEVRRLDELCDWLKSFVRTRHADGVERTLSTALRALNMHDAAGLLAGAAAHRLYADGGHLLDSCNKAFELMEYVGTRDAEMHVALLSGRIAAARGEEERSSWRHPVDLVIVAHELGSSLPQILAAKEFVTSGSVSPQTELDATREISVRLLKVLLGDDGRALVSAIGDALAGGAAPKYVSAVIAYAAALRLSRFSASNDVSDWFNVQHTFIFANAADRAVRRNPTSETVAAIVQAALAVHADRFLNVPPAKLPHESDNLNELPFDPEQLLERLLLTLDRRSIPGEADALTARYLRVGGPLKRLINTLTYATVREDLDFHSLQVLEAAVAQSQIWFNGPELEHIMIAVTRNLAAKCPTQRGALSTALIARRLHRGQALYDENSEERSADRDQ